MNTLSIIVIILAVIGMGASFGFCRYCDKWQSKCECEEMNPEIDGKD